MTRWARTYLVEARRACGSGPLLTLVLLHALTAAAEAASLALLLPLLRWTAGHEGDGTPLLLGLAGAVVIRAGASWVAAVLGSTVRLRTTDDLRLRAFDHLFAAEWRHLAGARRSTLVQATTTEIERAEQAFSLLLFFVVRCLVVLATALAAIVVAPIAGSLAVLLLVFALPVARRSVRMAGRLGVAWTERNLLFGATVTDSLAALRVVRAHEAADSWRAALTEAAARGRQAQHDFVRRSAAVQALLTVAAVAAVVALTAFGRLLDLDLAQLVTLALLTLRLLTSAQQLLGLAQGFSHHAPALDTVLRVVAEARRHAAPISPAPATTHTSGGETPLLELRGVRFGYDEGQPVLDGVDLAVPRAGIVAVTGPSGAGKSTLLDVCLGLIEPDGGEVLVDGRPLVDRAAWRRRVGYVPQQSTLVPGSVRHNVAWSAGREVSDEEVMAALDAAQLSGVLSRLPEGLDTQLRELPGLSGGEQQRICIARALVRGPDLLVLDEATSALDTATEEALLEVLSARSGATLLVSHRPAPLQRAQVVVPLPPR